MLAAEEKRFEELNINEQYAHLLNALKALRDNITSAQAACLGHRSAVQANSSDTRDTMVALSFQNIKLTESLEKFKATPYQDVRDDSSVGQKYSTLLTIGKQMYDKATDVIMDHPQQGLSISQVLINSNDALNRVIESFNAFVVGMIVGDVEQHSPISDGELQQDLLAAAHDGRELGGETIYTLPQ